MNTRTRTTPSEAIVAASSSVHKSNVVDTVQTADVHQFVTFIAGGELFAVDMAPVQEIIRVPEVVRVPLAPDTLLGLANLRGNVLPIINLRRVCGYADRERDDASRALVIDFGQPLGFVVDKVVSVLAVEASKLGSVVAIAGTVNTELLSGIITDVGGHAMIMVLDFAKLIAREFANLGITAKRTIGHRLAAERVETAAADTTSDELHLVSFNVADQEYAISIDSVQEIMQVPELVVQVPHAASHVLGVITLRERVLPLVSLRRMFALPAQDADERSRIVVVSVGNDSVGIVTDSVNEVLRVAKADVEPMPGLLARENDLADIAEICRLDGGKRLVSIVGANELFRTSTIQQALSNVAQSKDTQQQNRALHNESSDTDEQVVVLRLGKEEFGVPIESVQEIVRVPDELTRVPKSPSFVEGVINLRGAVLPVVDLRRRLGLPAVERSDRQRVMVFVINGTRTGFIVDSVAEVLRIRKSAIENAPRLSAEHGMLLTRMANLEQQQRIVQLIEPAHLFEGDDLTQLVGMAA